MSRFNLKTAADIFNFDFIYGDDILTLFSYIEKINSESDPEKLKYVYFMQEWKLLNNLYSVKFNKRVKIGHSANPLKIQKKLVAGNSGDLVIKECFKTTCKGYFLIKEFLKESSFGGDWYYDDDILHRLREYIYCEKNDWTWQKKSEDL
jgi:hypothetical protein